MIGDSITGGAEWQEMFPKSLVVNRGIGGDTTEGVLNRIDSIISTKANKAFIMIGINDISRGSSVDLIFSNYQQIVNELKTHQIVPYIQSTILAGEGRRKLNDKITKLNKRLIALSAKEGIVFIDLNIGLSANGVLSKEYSKDDVHLNGKGYSIWKNKIVSYF